MKKQIRNRRIFIPEKKNKEKRGKFYHIFLKKKIKIKNMDKSSNIEKAMIKMNFVRDTIMKEESIIGKKTLRFMRW